MAWPQAVRDRLDGRHVFHEDEERAPNTSSRFSQILSGGPESLMQHRSGEL